VKQVNSKIIHQFVQLCWYLIQILKDFLFSRTRRRKKGKCPSTKKTPHAHPNKHKHAPTHGSGQEAKRPWAGCHTTTTLLPNDLARHLNIPKHPRNITTMPLARNRHPRVSALWRWGSRISFSNKKIWCTSFYTLSWYLKAREDDFTHVSLFFSATGSQQSTQECIVCHDCTRRSKGKLARCH
jgi:hypothetical protein